MALLDSIFVLADAIYHRAKTVKANIKRMHRLSERIQLIVNQLKSLKQLPRQKQFEESLQVLEKCLTEVLGFVEELIGSNWLNKVFNANSVERSFDKFNAHLAELLTQLEIGLSAQQIFNQEEDKQDTKKDNEYIKEHLDEILVKEKEILKELQEHRLNPDDLKRILDRQLKSLSEQLKEQLKLAPQKSTLLPPYLQVKFHEVVFEKKIAQGSFGSIYTGSYKKQPVAIKLIERTITSTDREQFVREAQIMSRLRNEYITPFYGACLEDNQLCMLMGLMEKGDLENTLDKLSLEERLHMAKDLSRGLHYIHGENVIHGDIKAKNVLVSRFNLAKWADFGLSKTADSHIHSINEVSQEVCWQAPESFQLRAKLTSASDVYSFGLLLWSLFTGRLPNHELLNPLRQAIRQANPAAMSPDGVKEGLRPVAGFDKALLQGTPLGNLGLQGLNNPLPFEETQVMIRARFEKAAVGQASELLEKALIKQIIAQTLPSNLPPDGTALIVDCLASNPMLRPNASSIEQRLERVHLRAPSPKRPASPNGEALYEMATNEHKANHLVEAHSLYKRAADKGYAKAYASLGLFALEGLAGQKQDPLLAKGYLERGVAAGHARAMFNLARLYEKGVGVNQDLAKALGLYRQAMAADANDARAQEKVRLLSPLVESGRGFAAFSQ